MMMIVPVPSPSLWRKAMDSSAFVSGWNMLLYAVGVYGMMIIGLFRLDELIFHGKKNNEPNHPHPPIIQEQDSIQIISDHDGIRWNERRAHK
jgi:hypothetical protein